MTEPTPFDRAATEVIRAHHVRGIQCVDIAEQLVNDCANEDGIVDAREIDVTGAAQLFASLATAHFAAAEATRYLSG